MVVINYDKLQKVKLLRIQVKFVCSVMGRHYTGLFLKFWSILVSESGVALKGVGYKDWIEKSKENFKGINEVLKTYKLRQGNCSFQLTYTLLIPDGN